MWARNVWTPGELRASQIFIDYCKHWWPFPCPPVSRIYCQRLDSSENPWKLCTWQDGIRWKPFTFLYPAAINRPLLPLPCPLSDIKRWWRWLHQEILGWSCHNCTSTLVTVLHISKVETIQVCITDEWINKTVYTRMHTHRVIFTVRKRKYFPAL